MKRQNKHNAKKKTIYGITFHSTKEADRYPELLLAEKAGAISKLVLQPKFLLHGSFEASDGAKIRPIHYIADYMYYDNEINKTVVEDVKGHKTDVFKIKCKLFLKKYPEYVFLIT